VTELFTADSKQQGGPLADRMRPRTLDEVVGQDHIVGQGRLLRRAIQADRLSSVIFYGPPGTGKTSLAQVIAGTTKGVFENLNAVLSGIKDIREVIERAHERRRLYGTRTILFVDEVHRWNKAQQDALLPHVENGTVILVGATTENPFFEVNKALVSRSRIFALKPLTAYDLHKTALHALNDPERGYGRWHIVFEDGALDHLVEVASGDARSLLNALELAVETTPPHWPPPAAAEIYISFSAAEESIQKRAVLYDRDGDYHFDTISAFIKSVRGSDPDAALYWLAKMVRAGEDPAFMFRRMIILASEDVGLADPQALGVVIACAQSFDRIGFPEGNFPLAHACLYLATAPKSNTTLSFFDALKEIDREDAEVPSPLKDASRDREGFGHGEGYVYPHAYRDHWVAQQYLPAALQGKTFYTPSQSGYEARIREETLRKREIQSAIVLGGGQYDEVLTVSPASRGKESWLKRLEGGRSRLLVADREVILSQASIARHDRLLLPLADDGLLLWECVRRVPEGLVAGLVRSEESRDTLLRLSANLEEMDRPQLAVFVPLPTPEQAMTAFSCPVFDRILVREPWRQNAGAAVFAAFAENAHRLLADAGTVVLLQSPPAMGQRISRLLLDECSAPESLVVPLADTEQAFFSSVGDRWAWSRQMLEDSFARAGFSVAVTVQEQQEERLITDRDLAGWFDTGKSIWGAFIARALGEDLSKIHDLLQERIQQGPVMWKWRSLLLTALMPGAD
jgi:putative ATPase